MGEVVEFYDKDGTLLLTVISSAVPRRNETVFLPSLSKKATVNKVDWYIAEDNSPIIKVILNKLT